MEIKHITQNKADFLDLLLLADESETMIARYLDRGEMFALYDDDLKSICVVTQEGKNLFEDGVRIIVGKETRNTMGVAEPTMLVKGYRERRVACADLQYRAGCVVAIFYVFD